MTKWKGTVLERLTVNSSLYMVKYDGFDCVYGIELFKDNRVSNLQVLSEKVGECDNISLYLCAYFWFCLNVHFVNSKALRSFLFFLAFFYFGLTTLVVSLVIVV